MRNFESSQGGLSEQMTFEQRTDRSEQGSHAGVVVGIDVGKASVKDLGHRCGV